MGHPGVQEPWHVQKHFVGTWEVFRSPRSRAGPQRRRRNQDTEMYDLKKSDAVIVAMKQANNRRSTPCGVSGAKGRNRGEFGRLKDAPYSVCGESVMEVDRIRKAAKRNPEGCPTFRVLPAQRVGIPKPIEASRDQHPTGRWKRPLGTAD